MDGSDKSSMVTKTKIEDPQWVESIWGTKQSIIDRFTKVLSIQRVKAMAENMGIRKLPEFKSEILLRKFVAKEYIQQIIDGRIRI